jgi:hypothetical protein
MRTLICSEASSPAASSSDGGVSWGGVGSVPASDGVLWSASPANARTSFPRRCTFRYQATGSTARAVLHHLLRVVRPRAKPPSLCRQAAHLRAPPSIGARSSCSTGPRVIDGPCRAGPTRGTAVPCRHGTATCRSVPSVSCLTVLWARGAAHDMAHGPFTRAVPPMGHGHFHRVMPAHGTPT